MSKKRKAIRILLICIIIGLLGALFYFLYPYFQARHDHAQLKKEVVDDKAKKERKIDWDKLKKINPDIVAWIDFKKQPKIIDYPVLHRKNNTNYYLHRNYKGDYQYAGSIFMEGVNKPDFLDNNTILYGHNMNDGSMFAGLRKFMDKKFAKANRFFYIYTPDGNRRTYEVFCVMETVTQNKCYSYIDGTEDEFKAFLSDSNAENILGVPKDAPTREDSIVTLSTCNNRSYSGRIVVQGKLVEIKKTQ